MKFKPGDLVNIISVNGEKIKKIPPALVISSSRGIRMSAEREFGDVYTILYMGNIDRGVSPDWLSLIHRVDLF
jgi:hypothetical protein